ncbi:MAG: rRNA adenine dimethyltransferase family protein, partial [Candidatus Gracilibacteria bacterium]
IPQETSYKIVANIPYNITSHLINHFLQTKNQPISITLLVQKEVAEKIYVLNPDMTVLSLQVALFGKAKIAKKVPSSYFYPQPKVDSAIIHIELFQKNDPNFIPQEKALKILKVAKTCFSNRRKKLSNTLPEEYHSQAKKSGIDLSRRPETLSTQEWAAICLGDTSLQ